MEIPRPKLKWRLKLRKVHLLIPVFLILLTSILSLLPIPSIPSYISLVHAQEPSLEVYSDPHGTSPVSDIYWGVLYPSQSVMRTIYVKNLGTTAELLSLATDNWTPPEAETYLSLTWDDDGSKLGTNEVRETTLTLSVSPDIEEITDFSFDIHIATEFMEPQLPTSEVITDLTVNVSPSTVGVGEDLAVFGELRGEYAMSYVLTGVIEGAPIILSTTWGLEQSTVTGSDGSFIFQINAPTEGGDYTITVSFDGDDYFASCQATTTVTVTTPTPTLLLFEVELWKPEHLQLLETESNVEVLGNVKETPRYEAGAGYGWVQFGDMEAQYYEPLWMDSTLGDRFIIKCTGEKMVELISYPWVHVIGNALTGTIYDGQIVPTLTLSISPDIKEITDFSFDIHIATEFTEPQLPTSEVITDITINVSPSTVGVGEDLTVFGELRGEYALSYVLTGVIEGAPISLSTTWGLEQNTVTGSDGSFIFQINAPTEGGDYTITVSFDGDDYFVSCQATTTVTVTSSTPQPTPTSISFSVQVEAGNDDCHQRLSTGSFWLTYPTLSCGDSSSTAYDARVGIRFTNVNIPQGATIQSAYLRLKAYSYSGQLVNSIIRGEDVANAMSFSDGNNFDGRPRTSESVNWTPSDWVTDTWYYSPDIKTIIQAIVDNSGWVSGNALVIFWEEPDGWDVRDYTKAYSHDSGADNAPRLEVTYTV